MSENGRGSGLRAVARIVTGRRAEREPTASELRELSAALFNEAAAAADHAAEVEKQRRTAFDHVRELQDTLNREEEHAREVRQAAEQRIADADARIVEIEATAGRSSRAASDAEADARRRAEEADEARRELELDVQATVARLSYARAVLDAARESWAARVEDAEAASAVADEARVAAAEAIERAKTAAAAERDAVTHEIEQATNEVMIVVRERELAQQQAAAEEARLSIAAREAAEIEARAAATAADAERVRAREEEARATRAARDAKARSAAASIGRFPIVAVLVAVGLAICSVTDALSRATQAPSSWFLWIGVAVIVAPVVYRLCSADASPGERLSIVCLFGLALYAVKLMRDPFGFTMPDEFFHAYNAQQIVAHHVLFRPDSLLPITSKFPGLEGATSALMSMTGMSSFGAGIIVIGAARLTLMVALFLLFSKLSDSPRVGALGAAVYAGNSNFLLWGAQFSYESLTLPLLVVVLASLAGRPTMSKRERRAWFVPVLLVIATIVITHHLTSYLLDALLLVFALLPVITRRRMNAMNVWPFVAASVGLTLTWLVVVASETVGYISPVVDQAFKQTLNTLLGESSPRAPFSSSKPGALATPLGERIIAFAALGILFIALPFGLRAVWRKHRREPLAIVLCLGALGFFGVLGLRLAPSAWEVANRLGEFLFVGLGFVVAYAIVDRILKSRVQRFAPAIVALLVAVVVVGGAVTGWPADATLAAPTKIVADGHEIQSEALSVGDWVGVHLPGAGFAAPQSDARTILLYGRGRVLTGTAANIDTLLTTPGLTNGQLGTLAHAGLRYVVTDDRIRAGDNTHGYGFSVTSAGGTPDKLLPADVATKFDDLPAPRIYDSGNVRIYDLQGSG